MERKRRASRSSVVAALVLTAGGGEWTGGLTAQEVGDEAQPGGVVELTLERMVDYSLNSSYRVRHLNLNLERSRLYLRASRARLKSRVDLDLTVPAINAISETRWNSDLQREVISRENSRRVEAELAVRQPVILLGYPTNGYLSLNNRVYRLSQHGRSDDVQYYNRYFVRYTQPLFQTNSLKNDLEEAELDLENQELEYYGDVVEIVDNTADDYFELFEIAYEREIAEATVATLEEARDLAAALADADPDRAIELDQIRVELANARETLQSAESRFRLETSSLKAELGIDPNVTIILDPVIRLTRVSIDPERATRYALELTPRMRQLDIGLRENEIRLDETRGRGGFAMDLSLSYGREMRDEVLGHVWNEPENTYTVNLDARVPIWDWGERDARIQAQEVGLKQARLRIEQAHTDIRSDVLNQVRNIEEFESRAFAMEENLALTREITRSGLERYRDGGISVLDLLQIVRREADTANNFLDAYLGWRRALQRIQRLTFYDFERDAPVLERYGIDFDGS